MKFLKAFFSKVFITAVLIIVQIAWFALLFFKLSEYSVYFNVGFTIISILVVLKISSSDINGDYKVTWIVFILLMPLLGGLLYLCFGNKKPSRRLRKILEKTHESYVQEYKQDPKVADDLKQDNRRIFSISSYLYNYSGFPVWANSESKYYPTGEDMFVDMLDELKKAKHFIFMEYFIIDDGVMWDQIYKILIDKSKKGVDVRLMYDDFGSLFTLPKNFVKKMESKGIKCMAFNPLVPFLSAVMNNRNHRKMMVIDGNTVFTGGINLADEYINHIEKYGYWKDTGVLIRGEAVWNFTLMFLEMWNSFRHEDSDFEIYKPHKWHKSNFETDGFVQPYSDTPLDNENVGENVYIEILNQATDYVYIFTPYLIPSSEMKKALRLAAKQGVDVRIVTPHIADKKMVHRLTRSYYKPLLKSGVRIYEYTPGFIHAKSFVCDDTVGVVGTINMDYRSLYLHFECAALFYKSSIIKDLKEDALDTFEKSQEITLDFRAKRKGLILSVIDEILRLLAPLL